MKRRQVVAMHLQSYIYKSSSLPHTMHPAKLYIHARYAASKDLQLQNSVPKENGR